MDGRESESDTAGDFEENYGYSSYDELIEAIQSGAMVMDDNGDLIEIPQNQERTSPLTDRDVLELAANEIKVDDLTEGEQSALQIFKNRLTALQELQEQRTEQGRLYRQQQFGPNVDRIEAEKTRNLLLRRPTH